MSTLHYFDVYIKVNVRFDSAKNETQIETKSKERTEGKLEASAGGDLPRG